MLTTSIQSYRSLGLGTLEAGDLALSSKNGNFIKSVSSVCGVAENIPLISKICTIVVKIGETIYEKDRDFCVKKILDVSSKLYTDKKVLKAVTDAITIMITDTQFIENYEKHAEKSFLETVRDKYGEFEQSVMESFTGIKVDK